MTSKELRDNLNLDGSPFDEIRIKRFRLTAIINSHLDEIDVNKRRKDIISMMDKHFGHPYHTECTECREIEQAIVELNEILEIL